MKLSNFGGKIIEEQIVTETFAKLPIFFHSLCRNELQICRGSSDSDTARRFNMEALTRKSRDCRYYTTSFIEGFCTACICDEEPKKFVEDNNTFDDFQVNRHQILHSKNLVTLSPIHQHKISRCI